MHLENHQKRSEAFHIGLNLHHLRAYFFLFRKGFFYFNQTASCKMDHDIDGDFGIVLVLHGFFYGIKKEQ